MASAEGNGPQIGLLALEAEAYRALRAYPLDVLGAEAQGMVGYLIEQELRNRLPVETPVATLLTMVEVDPADPAFTHPSKPIGPRYSADEVAQLRRDTQWSFLPYGEKLRRVVPAPAPKRIVQEGQIRSLVNAGCIVICVGGGGIPCALGEDGLLHGLEAVIDKDHASGLLARDLHADGFLMGTDTRWPPRRSPSGAWCRWRCRSVRSPTASRNAHPAV